MSVGRILINGVYYDPAALPTALSDGEAGPLKLNPDRVQQVTWPEDDERILYDSGTLVGVNTVTMFAAVPGSQIALVDLGLSCDAAATTTVDNDLAGVPSASSFTLRLNANSAGYQLRWWPPHVGVAGALWEITCANAGTNLYWAARAIVI